jgi:ribosomal protein S4
MIKTTIRKVNLLRIYKRDLIGNIILKRKGLNIIKFLKKIYNIKKKFKGLKRKNNNFFRILNIPRPIYKKRKTKYGKYFILRQQFRIFYGFLKVRTLQRIIKRGFKKRHALNYFIYLMESRLDVLLYRLHFVSSVRMARQYIANIGILVNKRVVRNPNYNLRIKEILSFKEKDLLNHKKIMFSNIKKNF